MPAILFYVLERIILIMDRNTVSPLGCCEDFEALENIKNSLFNEFGFDFEITPQIMQFFYITMSF